MIPTGSEISLGQKVWSNHRWGEVVELKDGTFTVEFNTHAMDKLSNTTTSVHSSAEFQALWGEPSRQDLLN